MVKGILDGIQAEVDALVLEKNAVEKLSELLDYIGTLDSTQYTAESWEALQGDYDFWNSRREYLSQYSEDMVKGILDGIQAEVDALVELGNQVEKPILNGESNKAKFIELIEYGEKMEPSDFTADSWDAFITIFSVHEENYSSSFVMSRMDEFDFERACSEILLAFDLLKYQDDLTAKTNYALYHDLLDYFESVDNTNYENYSIVKENVDYFVRINSNDIEDLHKGGNIIPYQTIKTLQTYIDALVPKDATTVSLKDDATGIVLTSDSNNFTDDLTLEIQHYDGTNWPYNMAGSWMSKIPSNSRRYDAFRIILRDKEGLIHDTKRGFNVTIPVDSSFNFDKISVSATYTISPELNIENRTISLDISQDFVPYVNGNSLFVTEPLSSVNPQTLEDGVYSVSANVVKDTNASVSSMSNNTLVHEATLLKSENDVYIYLELVPMYVLDENTPSYVGGFWCEKGKQGDGDYYFDSETVLSYYTDNDGRILNNSIYNGVTEIPCVKQIKLKLEEDCFNENNGYTLCVMAPDMAAMNGLNYDEIITDSLRCTLIISEPSYIGSLDMMEAELPTFDITALQREYEYANILANDNIYTNETWSDVQALLDSEITADDENCVTGYESVAELTDRINKYKVAIGNLIVSENSAVDKTNLEAAIAKAKAITPDEYTTSSFTALAQAIETAEKVLAKDGTIQPEIEAQVKALESAIDSLVNRPTTALDKDNLADGKYTFTADMIKIDRESKSMSDNAINHTMELEVKNGEYFVTIHFKGLSIYNQFGYLKNLGYYDTGYTYNEYGVPKGTVISAEVLTTQKDENGNDVIDQYNDKDNLYPETLRFKLVDKASEEYVPLQVFVPIMESISAGSGTQDVLMYPDWSTLEKMQDPQDATTTTETTTTTTSATTTTTSKNIVSDDDLCKWASNDYKDKTGVTPANAAITDTYDGKYTITLTDDAGNVLDTYVIDPETGVGTNAANEEVNLPQTGNNSLSSMSLALVAFAMTGIGMAAVVGSGVLKKKEENE